MRYRLPILCLLTASLIAKPEGFRLVEGEAKLSAPHIVESGKKAVIHWDQFSIGKDEVFRFIQQDSKSAVLNRVVGSQESLIAGSLESNGSVFLINPQGIVIEKGARIDTAGFLASTSNIANEDFFNDRLLFSGDSSAPVVNLGTISCAMGDVTLIAKTVRNEGEILAPEGTVTLAAAKEIFFQLDEDERVFIRPEKEQYFIEHSGSIEAASIEIKNAGSPYAQAIRSSGKIDALKRHEDNGRVYLVAEQGKVEVTGEIRAEGGEVQVLGDYVRIDGNAKIDVSAAEGGGEVFIGSGDATAAYVSKDAQIRADALVSGDGGKVIVRSDKATGFYGKASAEGGKEGGDGGLVEVSGKYLDYQGISSTVAPLGKIGTLLLDPNDIQLTGATTVGAIFFDANYFDGANFGGNVTLDVATVAANLATNNVIIESDDQVGTGTGLIQVSMSFTWATETMLTLRASGNIIVDPGVTVQNTSAGGGAPFGAITFIANYNHVLAGPLAGILIDDGVLQTDAGDIYLEGTGGNTMMDNRGIELSASGGTGRVFSNTGAITLIGRDGPENTTASDNNIGVFIHHAVAGGIVSTAGPITILGTSFATGVGNQGIRMSNNSLVDGLVSSNILMKGTGGSGTTNCDGIRLQASVVQAASGNIHMIGKANGSAASTDNTGIVIINDSQVISTATVPTNASILLEGTGGEGAATANHGVNVQNTLDGVTSVDADITIIGHGGANTTGTGNVGVSIGSNASVSSTSGGDIAIIGYGGTGGTSLNHGVHITTGAPFSEVTSMSGNISIYGEAGTGDDASGVLLVENGRVITVDGNIEITGIAELASGANCKGVNIHGSEVTSTGASAGTIIIKGVSSDGATNFGIGVDLLSLHRAPITNVRTRISSVNHDIIISGIGGGTGRDGYGIALREDASATLATQIEATGTGSIYLDGKGSQTPAGAMTAQSNHGVFIHGIDAGNNGFVQTDTGDIVINGLGGVGDSVGANLPHCDGIFLNNFARVTTVSGNIKMTGDAIATLQSNYGIQLLDSCTIESTTLGAGGNSIILEGSGSSNGSDSNDGVRLENNCVVQTTSNDISIVGYGNRAAPVGMAGSTGIVLGSSTEAAACTIQSTNGGSISLSGAAPTAGVGVIISHMGVGTNSTVSTTSGDIQIYGRAGNFGIWLEQFGEIVTTDGNISIHGEAFGTGDKRDGILVDNQSIIHATGMGKGSIALNGTGSINGDNVCFGVLVDNSSQITTGTHDIDITGEGGGTKTGNVGIGMLNSSSISSTGMGATGGAVRLNGIGGNGTDVGVGVYLTGAGVQITSVSGDISLLGQARGTGANCVGIVLENQSQVTSTMDAAITLQGAGSPNGSASAAGVILGTISAVTLSSVDGDITINGLGGGRVGTGIGVAVLLNSNVTSTGNARIFIDGTGGNCTSPGGSDVGVLISGMATNVTSTTGNIFVREQGQGEDTSNHGISLISGGTIQSLGTASMTLQGIGSYNGSDSNHGIHMAGGGLTSTDGDITVVGQGGGAATGGAGNTGVNMDTSAITASMGGSLNIYGTAGPGNMNNRGVFLVSSSSLSANLGNIYVTGISNGITGVGIQNYGIEINGSSTITSTGVVSTSVGGKTVRIEGIGAPVGIANNYGLYIHSGSSISSTTQDVYVRAEAGAATSEAIRMDQGNISCLGASSMFEIVTRSSDGSGGDLFVGNLSNVSAQNNLTI